MTTRKPCAALKDRVAAIDVVENQGGEVKVLPSAGAVLGFQFRGRVRSGELLLSTAGVTGIQQSTRQYLYEGDTASILVRFTPQGAACLGVPAMELTGQSVALSELISQARAREAQERLLHAVDVNKRVAIVEELLLGLNFVEDRLIARALDLLTKISSEDASIAGVARSLSLSERQLERRFLLRIGITPKRFVTLRRFERAVALARSSPSLTSLAIDAGYYDQSHFIREFRRFTGVAPGVLLRGPR